MANTDRDRKGHIKHIQELLCLAGYGVLIDGILGPATQTAIKRFQAVNHLSSTGTDDTDTMIALTRPICAVAIHLPTRKLNGYAETVAYCAETHLYQHPREVGGQNRGPWVRLYMDGIEGQPWCAGFVTYIIKQAAELLRMEEPLIAGSVSCAELARQAGRARLFRDTFILPDKPVSGSIMLVRRGPHGYNHCGIVTASDAETFETIEGNTNDHGSPERYEVCKRTRSYTGKDFIVWKT